MARRGFETVMLPGFVPGYAAMAVALTAASAASNASTSVVLNSPSGPRGVRSRTGAILSRYLS
jgi:hypothetical protein